MTVDDYRRNILVEREVLDSNSGAAAGHVALLVSGSHLLSKDIYLRVGERLKDVLEEALSSGFTFRRRRMMCARSWQNW